MGEKPVPEPVIGGGGGRSGEAWSEHRRGSSETHVLAARGGAPVQSLPCGRPLEAETIVSIPRWDNEERGTYWLLCMFAWAAAPLLRAFRRAVGRAPMLPPAGLVTEILAGVLLGVGAVLLLRRHARAQLFAVVGCAFLMVKSGIEIAVAPAGLMPWLVLVGALGYAIYLWINDRETYPANSFYDVIRKPWKRAFLGAMLQERLNRPVVDLSTWSDEEVWSYVETQLRSDEDYPFGLVTDASAHRLQPALRRALCEPWVATPRKTTHFMQSSCAVLDVLPELEPTEDDRAILRHWAAHEDDAVALAAMKALVPIANADDIELMSRRYPAFEDLEVAIQSAVQKRRLGTEAGGRVVDRLLQYWNDGNRVRPDALELAASCAPERVQSWVEAYPDPTEARRAYLFVDGCQRAELELPIDRVRALLDVPWPDDQKEHDARWNRAWRSELLICALMRSDRDAARAALDQALEDREFRSLDTLIEFDLQLRGMPEEQTLFEMLREAEESPGGLTWEQQVHDDIFMLDAEVRNGGFTQWFFNSRGVRWEETIRGLEEVGAPQTAALVRDACSCFGPDGPGRDYKTIEDRLSKLPKAVLDSFEELDNAFYEDPDRLMLRLHEYCLAHREHFWDRVEPRHVEAVIASRR